MASTPSVPQMMMVKMPAARRRRAGVPLKHRTDATALWGPAPSAGPNPAWPALGLLTGCPQRPAPHAAQAQTQTHASAAHGPTQTPTGQLLPLCALFPPSEGQGRTCCEDVIAVADPGVVVWVRWGVDRLNHGQGRRCEHGDSKRVSEPVSTRATEHGPAKVLGEKACS